MSAPAPEQPAAAAGTLTLGGDVVVRRMGFGARWVTVHGAEAGCALLRRALELGVNLIDTGGTSSIEHLEENVWAAELGLSDDELALLETGTEG